MTTETKEEEIKISEEKDGSVIVEGPQDMFPEEEAQEEKEPQMAEGGDAEEEEDQPDDTDSVREARRARRKAKKEYIKKVNQEKDQRLVFLQRQNQELMERLAALEKRSHTSDLAQIDKAMRDEETRLNWARAQMKEATDNSDGQAFIKAQEVYENARKRMEMIQSAKSRAEQSAPQSTKTEPEVQRLAYQWMEKNPWYDPDGDDEDSRIAKRLDTQLAEEGYNPATPSYWNELDRRLQRKLPHIYTDETEEPQVRRAPKSVVTGSEREVGGGSSRTTFTLTPDQVKAMKDAGFWDDPVMKKKMIARYANYAKQQRS
jgi:hypothetical protein